MMRKNLRSLLCVLCALAIAVAGAGCGSKSGGSKGGDIKVDSKLKGTTVKVLLWYEPDERETSVSDAFMEKTGINVKYITTNTGSYQTKLASLVASGASPDLACMTGDKFPTMIIRGLLSELDEKYFDLSNEIYDMQLMDAYKWDDKYYTVAVKGSMMGSMYCVYYNKSMFEERGVETPYEIWKNNPDDWTWDKYSELAKKMTYTTAAGTVYGSSCSYPQAMMLSTGEDFVKVEGKNIINNMSSQVVKNAWKYANRGGETDKSSMPGNAHYIDLIQNKVAMHVNGQWFMQAGQSYAKEMQSEWGVVPYPKQNDGEYYIPFSGAMWGVAKGAENVEGAAAFINYWLDPKNAVAAVYANEECEEVHKWMWEQPKSVCYSEGVLTFKSTAAFNNLFNSLMQGAAAVDTVMASNSPVVDSNIKLVLDELS